MNETLEHPIPMRIHTERERIRNDFMETYDLHQVYTDHWCLRRWIPEGCQGEKCHPAYVPHFEHAESFRRTDGEWVLTYEPYEGPTDTQKERLDQICREDGVQWREWPEKSWHTPGWTTLVVLERRL